MGNTAQADQTQLGPALASCRAHPIGHHSRALARVRDELRGWRRRRKQANERLYDWAKGFRDLCRGVFDEDEGDIFLGLHGTLPRQPKELHAALGPVVRRIADIDWPMPEHSGWFKVDRDKLVRSLIETHDELGQALAAIKEGETREAVAQAAKTRAEEAHKLFLGKSARFLEAALELAGLDDLAVTVRPNVGRRGRPPKKELAAAAGLPVEGRALPAAIDGAPVAQLTPGEAPESAADAGPASAPASDGSESAD